MSEISIYHNSRLPEYRNPFGAVVCGASVDLSADVAGDFHSCDCKLHVWLQNRGELLFPLSPAPSQRERAGDGSRAGKRFHILYTVPDTPGLIWYYFIVTCDGQTYFYGNNDEGYGGEGKESFVPPRSYQITVYRYSPVPDWWKEGLVYQIYVDRFARGKDWKQRVWDAQGSGSRRGPTRLLQMDWRDTPFICRDDQGRVERWPFFGGTLDGVREKLSYLKGLGVTIIYLNPIFEAASNHKYDTGDYMRIDPGYGDEESFRLLAKEASEWGISLILDGVFSHTGADSVYFNKYGNYPGEGACQSTESRWYPLYRFERYPDSYECWWGVDDLPNVDETHPVFEDLIWRKEDSVIRHWLRAGARGWRLDVADELPAPFIRSVRKAVRETIPDGLLLGEVWEDASNKHSYGRMREYFLGEELDAVMNYPFRDICIDFIMGRVNADTVHERVMSLFENYPRENFQSCMNLIGSHDSMRVLSLLGEAQPEEGMTEWEKQSCRMDRGHRDLARRRLKLLSAWQAAFPGVPAIYYGDEAGVEGYSDPYNRAPFPWGREDPDILAWYRLLGNLRSEYELFRIGNFESFVCDGNIYGFSRSTAGERVVALLNPSKDRDEKTTLTVADGEEVILELLSGAALDAGEAAPDGKRLLNLSLNRLEAKMIYFKKAEPSSFPMKNLPRMSGVLCHITSLPSEWGCGGFGQESYDFCDYLAAAGQGLWQILPLNPVGAGNSPYSSCSVFAGNELFVDCALLARDGLLKPGDCSPADVGTNSSPAREKLYGKNSDFERARKNKLPLFRKAFAAFDQNDPEYLDFCGENEEWLADYCLYRAISEKQKGRPWQEWPAGLRERDDGALAKARARLEESIAYHRFIQYEFSRQWKQLKERANRRGVRILGDIPFYVSAESADAWSNRSLFALDARGASEKNSGVPPDPFCPQGQNWKMPVYLWDNHKNLGYAWWIRRMRRGAELHDYLRLDHFRGFDAFWQIPGGEETAVNGYWVKGPGKAFFEALEAALGPLPILAENLGFLTPGVANLKNTFSWPGISVYQFESDEFENEKTPNADRMRALYTGTHDNDTLAGWLRERNPSMPRREIKSECRRILRRLYADDAMWVLSPLQDVFALDSRARMNTPGLAEGNWTWAAPRNAFSPESARFLRGLAEEFRRNASPV